ncbi:subunit of the TIM22-complex [Scheffersomyces xylosifermentans]|uniref:subunit of the TIM22-complex n=1 Tax=Scheffersomyces xylosifermentans TaxID=1304137 RepID=UPI00315C4C05
MSMFMGNTSQYSYANVDQEKLNLAEIQFDATSKTFNKILKTCEAKCLPHEYGESDLNTGESCCIDRCVSKYVKANLLIGTNFQEKRVNPYNNMPEYEKVRSMMTGQGGQSNNRS